jgi:hypothetical protein
LLSLEEEACCNPEKCGRFGREGRLFYMPWTEPQFLCRPAPNLVTTALAMQDPLWRGLPMCCSNSNSVLEVYLLLCATISLTYFTSLGISVNGS